MDARGNPFHHKNLTLFNLDLSKVVIVDNKCESFYKFEPNAILCKDYFGKDTFDDELSGRVLPILEDLMFLLEDEMGDSDGDEDSGALSLSLSLSPSLSLLCVLSRAVCRTCQLCFAAILQR